MAGNISDADLQAAEEARVMRVLEKWARRKLKQVAMVSIGVVAGAAVGYAYGVLTLVP